MSRNATEGSPTRTGETPRPGEHASLFLLYHELRPEESAYTYALSVDAFRTHLELFSRLCQSSETALRPEITFDDGHASNHDFALPLLTSSSITARFFITAGWTSERPGYMTWDQLKELHRAGQHIGAHGWSHKLLTQCSPSELDTELRSARLLLEDKLGTSITTMSLPGGRFNTRVLQACQQAGYTQVFTSIPRAETSPNAQTVGRFNIRANFPLSSLQALFTPGDRTLQKLERNYRLKETAQRTLGDRTYAKLWALLNRADPDAQTA